MRQRWRKILYEDQGVPDNYVDQSFLDDLRKNLYTSHYDFWPVVLESGVVTQQMSSVCLFVVAYFYMEEERVSPVTLFTIAAAFTLFGYILNDRLDHGQERALSGRTRRDDLKTAVLYLGFSYGVSPILMTLTRTISTDTVYAMTIFMLLGNLLFHDYGTNAAMVSQSLSLNAAIFASVCLASRLSTTFHAFTTVTLSVQMFALWPVLRRRLKKSVSKSQLVMTVMLGMSALVAISTLSTVGGALFFVLFIFVSLLCPAWLIRLQPYKNNIHGPWEEAIIQD